MPRASISGSAFGPKEIRVMLEVYDEVVAELQFPAEQQRMRLANLLMKLCAGGAADKQRLKTEALQALKG